MVWVIDSFIKQLVRRTGELDLDVLRSRSKYSNRSENAPKYAFRDPKWKQIMKRGTSRPLPYGEGDTSSTCFTPYMLGTFGASIFAPSALNLAPINPNHGCAPAKPLRSQLSRTVIIECRHQAMASIARRSLTASLDRIQTGRHDSLHAMYSRNHAFHPCLFAWYDIIGT